MELPSLAALAALEAVLRLGSITAAARELRLTQSAVSHRLRALEDELGSVLIERAGRGVRLTPSGARLAQASGEALDLLREAVGAVRAVRGAAHRVLSISCSPSFATRFLVPRLANFRAAHPELDLRIAAADLPVDPQRAGVDALVRLCAGPVPRLVCEKLVDEVVFPVMSPRLREHGPPLRSASDLREHTLLHDEWLADDPQRVDWAAWLKRAGVRRRGTLRSVHFSHAYLALEAAVAGDGVALARRSLVADDLERGRLVAPLAPAIPSGLAYWLITALPVERVPALEALRTFLKAELARAHERAEARARAFARPCTTEGKEPIRKSSRAR